MDRILIHGGRIVDPASGRDEPGAVAVAGGRIVSLGRVPADFQPDRRIDASGCIVAPGLVDLAARLREPGMEHEGLLESELAAAAAGGVTSLVCPPDTDPPLDEPGLVEMLKFRARKLSRCRLFPLGALTRNLAGKVLTEMAELTEAGCVGFGQAERPVIDTNVLLRAMQYAATFGHTVWLRPNDHWLGSGVAASGPVATRLGLAGVPVAAETIALHTIVELVRATGARVHLCRLSSAAAVALLRAARAEGLPLTADVSINSLHLTDVDIGYFDPDHRLDPPLRTQRDRDAIRAALADGTIDAICSDHAPVAEDDKLLPFGEAAAGASALETLLPLVLKWGEQARLPLAAVLAKVSSAAAQVLGEPTGRLAVGAKADVAVFDPQAPWTVGRAELVSRGGNTPFSGYELVGRVALTLVGGEVRFDRKSGSESNFR